MKIQFYTLEDGKDTPAGSLEWNGSILVADPPDSPALKLLATSPIRVPGGQLTQADGDEFLAALPRMYRSAYFRAVAV